MIHASCYDLIVRTVNRTVRCPGESSDEWRDRIASHLPQTDKERYEEFAASIEQYYRQALIEIPDPFLKWSFEVPHKIFADCHSVDVTMTRLENSIQSHGLDWVMLKSKISYTDAVQILKDQGNRQVITHTSQSELGDHSNYLKNLIAEISEDFVDDLDFYTFDAEGTYPADQLVSTFGVCTVKHNTIQRVIFL